MHYSDITRGTKMSSVFWALKKCASEAILLLVKLRNAEVWNL